MDLTGSEGSELAVIVGTVEVSRDAAGVVVVPGREHAIKLAMTNGNAMIKLGT